MYPYNHKRGQRIQTNVLEATDPAVTTDKDNIEGNTIDLESALGGSVVDIYLIV